MTLRHDIAAVFLFATVLCCWIGTLGMWRMRTPMAALHYVSLPSAAGAALLAIAAVFETGFGQVGCKSILIAVILLGFSIAVTHATAHAFRVRAVRQNTRLSEAERIEDPLGFQALAREQASGAARRGH